MSDHPIDPARDLEAGDAMALRLVMDDDPTVAEPYDHPAPADAAVYRNGVRAARAALRQSGARRHARELEAERERERSEAVDA